MKKVIMIVGPPQSGKTTASSYLETKGYRRISASAVIGRLDDASKRIVDRSALIERGERLLHEKGATWFAERLLNEASGSPKVVFDGIRPVDTIRYILEKVPQAQVLFIKTPELKRRARYNRVNSPSSMPYDQVANAAVEATARGVEPLAIEISNDGSLEEFYESIQKAIEPKRSRWRAGSPDPG